MGKVNEETGLGGAPFAILEARVAPPRRKLTDDDLYSFFRFCNGKTGSKLKLLAQFHRQNRHLRKSDLQRKFKEYFRYERRPEDKQKRWYVTSKTEEDFSLKAELDTLFQAVQDEKARKEAALSLSKDAFEPSSANTAARRIEQRKTDLLKRQPCPVKGNHYNVGETVEKKHAKAVRREKVKPPRIRCGTSAVPEMQHSVKAAHSSPPLRTFNPTKQNSVVPPSTTSQESVPDARIAQPSCIPSSKSTGLNKLNLSVPDCATSTTSTASPRCASALMRSHPFLSGGAPMKNTIATPRCVDITIAKSVQDDTIPHSPVRVPAARFEADGWGTQKTAEVSDYGFQETGEKMDSLDTLDSFTSAAATAALAASSAQAAAITAYKQRPAESASATRVALMALTAARLANEVARGMSGRIQSLRKLQLHVSPPFGSPKNPFCSGVVSARVPLVKATALVDSNYRGKLEEDLMFTLRGPEEAALSAPVTTTTHGVRERNNETSPAPRLQTSPAKSENSWFQQYSPANQDSHDGTLDKSDSKSGRKRRKSDGSVQSCYGPADDSVSTCKKTKRPSFPSGALPTSGGAQLKNALITKFFKVVPQTRKRPSNVSSEEVF